MLRCPIVPDNPRTVSHPDRRGELTRAQTRTRGYTEPRKVGATHPGNWATEPLTLTYSCQQRCKSGTVEADDDFTVDPHHGRGHITQCLQLFERLLVLRHISLDIGNTSLRK